MSELVWCDPPPPASNRWATRLAPLIERPGEWALVRRFDDYLPAHQLFYDLRGRRRTMPAGRFEFRAGRLGEGQLAWGVWARYLGPDDRAA